MHKRQFSSVRPKPTRTEAEAKFRAGYVDGFADAIRLIVKLKAAGYVRPQEIANILGEHYAADLIPWRKLAVAKALTEPDAEPTRTPPPSPKVTTWADVRRLVFARDGHLCAFCKATKDLEIDHVEPVCEGGRPDLTNLRVLCKRCNVERNKAAA